LKMSFRFVRARPLNDEYFVYSCDKCRNR